MHRIGKIHRARRDERRVFTEAVSGRDVGENFILREHARRRDSGRQHRRLREFRLHELRVRPFKHETGQRKSQRLIRFFQKRFHDVVLVVQVARHADFLRSLSRENHCLFHSFPPSEKQNLLSLQYQRSTTEPQVSPAPKPVSIK